MRIYWMLASVMSLWLLMSGSGQAAEVAIYARSNTQFDQRNEYPVKLLEMALRNSGADITLESSKEIIPQGRAMNLVLHNEGVHVLWAMTSEEREIELLPIKVPIYKGLIGWRLCIVHPDNADRLAGITSLAELRGVVFVQGHDWPDLEILRSNQLMVESVSNYQAMFKMIGARHVDAFPRAVIEIWPEVEAHDNLQVDSHLLIRYPAAVYYFVNRQNKPLHDAISAGLNTSIANGDFERLFNAFYSDAINRAQLEHRKIIDLKNPLLPTDTPIDNLSLWYR
ncbi:transporter substrate-binding domain-containing protein [Hahella sp. CCB-MM4]|uniref:transporter substrate-binding domain-containing protein n=1 Tax=Hahella sp. (strain CCB-MM4) TaxID=1926491 RepID=UPI00143D12DB|nr:transporter substrate-binding domain-containing protein [Hahella sp. CCB-MM4]